MNLINDSNGMNEERKKERKIYELIELITFCVDYDDDGVYYATVCGAFLFSFCCVLAFAAALFCCLFFDGQRKVLRKSTIR